MVRQLLLKLAARMKAFGLADTAIRYNPLIRRTVQAALSSKESSDVTQARLTQRILKAAQRTDYGKGRSEDIHTWPVLRKAVLFAEHQRFVNPAVLLRIPAGTGGTSGTPLTLWRSLESAASEQIFIDQLLAPYGCDMRNAKIAVLRADTIAPAENGEPRYGFTSHGGKRLTLSSMLLSSENIRWYYNALNEMQPDIVWVYPNSGASLMTLLKHEGLTLTVPVILASSETLNPDAHRALEDFFHATVINYYGQAERAVFAYSTEPGVFYFNPNYGLVELEAMQGDATETLKQYKIIGTGFWNRGMPLIRYDTDDFITLPPHYGAKEIAQICSGTRPFYGIAGREGEFVLTRDGVKIIGLNHIPREVKNIAQVQLVQYDYDRVDVRVLPLPGFGEEDAAKLLAQTRAKLPDYFTIRVDLVEKLYATERGKMPFVVNRIGL